MALPFLLEIGCEEIPDWMIEPALADLKKHFEAVLAENKLSGSVKAVDATPRRLVLEAEGLPERQADAEETVSGPPKSSGAGAAAGFAKKQGVTVDQLQTVTTAKGEYFSFTKKVEGRSTIAILTDAVPGVIERIYFPKSMYWTGKGGFRFIRPIRWIVALLGEEIVPFAIAGVKSGNITQGHRRLGARAIPVTAANYRAALSQNFVIGSAADRRSRISAEIAKLAVTVKPDPKLLETLVYITEYPTPITGTFDPKYLALPSEVLVTVMRHHQKYFSCVDSTGALAANFVAVMNTANDDEGLVRQGNERVLRARFNDARFFYEADQQKRLADRVGDLEKVTFQAKLGSYLEKTRRNVELVKELAGNAHAQRAAELAKCDLTTEMVKEFTDLQGIIGGIYARVQGEPEPVAMAIYEHYKPLSMEDTIPSTAEGRIVALADKLDTLRGCFKVGMIPKGSSDPFALRRAAQGIVKILVEGQLQFSLTRLCDGDEALREFMLDRVRYYFREVRGFKYDELNAVLKTGADDLVNVEARLKALQAVRPTENFEPLAASFKRIQNILKQANFSGGGSIDPTLLEAGPEQQLHEAFTGIRQEVGSLDFQPALEKIAMIRPSVDLFFDKVLVNAPDPKVRANRLTLLSSLLTEFSTIADFSEIVTQ